MAIRTSSDRSPQEGLMIALHDAIDSALDMTHGHCPHLGCDSCREADTVVRPIRNMIDALHGTIKPTPATAKREMLTAKRKLERMAQRKNDGGLWMHQSRAEHEDPEGELTHAQMMLTIANANDEDADPEVIGSLPRDDPSCA
jgi:hypothetical protein